LDALTDAPVTVFVNVAELFTQPPPPKRLRKPWQTLRLPQLPASAWLQYAIAVTAFVISLLLRYVLDPWLPRDRGFVLFLPAVVLTKVFAGLGPALLTASLSFVALWYAFTPPYYSFELDAEGAVRLAAFFFACVVITALVHWLRATIDRLEVEQARLEEAEGHVKADLLDMVRLNELASFVRDEAQFNRCLDAVIDAAMAITVADKGNVQLVASNSDTLTITVQRGFEDAFLNFFADVRNDDPSACGQAMRSDDRVIVEDVMNNEIFVGQASQQVLIDAGVRGVISVLLKSSKKTLMGMISVHFSNPHRPTERELRLLDLLARQTADYLERKRAEQTEKLLVSELEHRANNLLSVVQSIAFPTLSGDLAITQARKTFEARLQALARANLQLTKSDRNGITLRELLRLELEPYGNRATIEGADVMIGAQRAHNVALALHELATNATKYGALSNESGKIDARWTIARNDEGNVLKFEWQERGGPIVVAPTRHGFGTALLQAISQNVHFNYSKAGLSCAFDMLLYSPEI
jgi:two-component sensor histidine kinase